MSDSTAHSCSRIVVDSIHGDIALTDQEWRIVDTASFQRLRYIKQLGMAHLVYPNATHTRFAHCIGALRIMQRILDCARRSGFALTEEQEQNLRLAALLHDIGHYPYSHLMEGLDKVSLIEEFIASPASKRREIPSARPYPRHVDCGALAVTTQPDLIKAIGGAERARAVADLFARGAADPQLSKLVSSSLDMDRLDYLLRDARAVGVPYGEIDLNYILNSFRVSKTGVIGVTRKALPAVEHFLFARYFMTRTVYHHKTTYAFEEAARHLLRRVRDTCPDTYKLPMDGDAVEKVVCGPEFKSFTDSFLDGLLRQAAADADPIIGMMADSLLERREPKLLREVPSLSFTGAIHKPAAAFERDCGARLVQLAGDRGVDLRRFIFCKTKPLAIETLPSDAAKDELLRVFIDGQSEPRPIAECETSMLAQCAKYSLTIYRLYVVDDGQTSDAKYKELREVVCSWGVE